MRDVFDLPHLITDVIADVQPAADDKGVHVAAHQLAAMPHWVEGDEAALRRMLLNTLDLVVGAATDGAVLLRIEPHDPGRHRWLCVVGWRGQGDDAIEEVKSAFVIALEPADAAGNAGPFRVLVVDDSAQHRAMIAAYLAPTPHTVTEADSGEDAVTRTRAGGFDVILMDVQMPGIGGLEAVRLIREQEIADARPRAHIITLSAMGAGDDETASQFAGADECLPKPLGRDALLRALAAAPVTSAQTSTEQPGFSPADTVGLKPDGSEDALTSEAALNSSQLLALARHQLGTILSSAPGTQVERLRMLGQALKTSAADAGLTDIAHLAAALEEASATASLTDAQTAARTLQAWVLRSHTAVGRDL